MPLKPHPTDPDKVVFVSRKYEGINMKTPEDEEFERIDRKQNELIQVATSLSKDAEDIRNNVLEEVAQEIEELKGFGEDTIASFTVYIRSMKK